MTAAAISLVACLMLGILSDRWMEAGIGFFLLWVFSYFLIHTILQQFIYRNIKLIYKFISQTKATQR